MLEGRARFAGRSSFKTWLFGVSTRRRPTSGVGTSCESSSRCAGLPEEALGEAAPAADAKLAGAQQHMALERALRELPRRQREVVLLVFYHELTVEDAAAVMEIGVGSARQHYARGKDRLRGLLSATETE